ncbi:hypothetical protein HUW86_00670 [Fusobacterium sp. SB021]|uniref:hypothetical protein n=1 Tax=Fusobacterium sp. SB021 TaxID=2744227 RepID=UPI003CF293D5
MKKLALLLGALSLVSSVAYAKEVVPAVEEVVVVEEAAPVAAAPMLRVTNVGQYIEIDNYSRHVGKGGAGDDKLDIGNVMLGHQVGLAYGDDWTFNLMARKGWDTDTDDGMHSAGHRIDIDVWRSFDNFSVGARWRQEANKDRYLLRTKYNYGMFSGWVDAGYESQNGEGGVSDNWYSEGMPVAVTVGPVTAGYYYEWDDVVDYHKATTYEGSLRHQIRLMAPLYTGEKLGLSAEYRYQFAEDKEYKENKEWQENNRHIAILNANYALTENLSVYGYYQYEWNKYEVHDGGKNAEDLGDDYYGEFAIGWNYAF